MRKREKKEARTDLWMNTYADMVTLLLTFFVFLMSIATFDEAKLKDFFQSFGGAFGVSGSSGAGVLIGGSAMSSDGGSLGAGNDTVERIMNSPEAIRSGADTPGTGRTAKVLVSQETKEAFERTALRIMQAQQGIQAEVTAQGLRIELQEQFARFASGSAQLPADSTPKLEGLIRSSLDAFIKDGHEIVVSGHTDNVPLGGATKARYTDNRGLAAERANNVLRIFERLGVPPQQISAAGYGEFVPKADNSTDEGRAQNRRIEILVKFKEFSPNLNIPKPPTP
jgi:chemotaxis protein MotB